MTFLQLFVPPIIYTAPELRSAVFKVLERVIPSRSGLGLSNEQSHQKRTLCLGRPGWSRGRSYPLCLLNVNYPIDSKLLFNATRKTIAECTRLSPTCQQVGWRQCRNNVNVVLYSSI